MSKIKKSIYIIIGFLAFTLGTIGAFLPILPTTPFLLLASFCFARGSERFNIWFTNTSLYKKHLDTLVRERAMTLKQKVCLLAFADFMMAFPLIIIDNYKVKFILILLILFKFYYFIFRIKTIKPEKRPLGT